MGCLDQLRDFRLNALVENFSFKERMNESLSLSFVKHFIDFYFRYWSRFCEFTNFDQEY